MDSAIEKNELPRSRAARYQKEFSFNPDAEHRGILLIKEQILTELKRDPFADPASWLLVEKRVPKKLWSLLTDRSGAAQFTKKLPTIFDADSFIADTEAQRCWEIIGNFYKNQGRFHEAISIYFSLYDQYLVAQEKTKTRAHKGTPLVWISDCYSALRSPVLAKRYLMLTLCEDAIRESGRVSPNTTGIYFRLVWGGLPDLELQHYAKAIYKLSKNNPDDSMFPEWIIQELDQHWMTEFPSAHEDLRDVHKKVNNYLLSMGRVAVHQFIS